MALKLLTALVATLLSLGAVELTLAIVGRPVHDARFCPGERQSETREYFVADPLLGWRMRPEHTFAFSTEGRLIDYRSDQEGFRTGGQETARAERPMQVVITGDSYAWGYGVPYAESLAAQLAQRLLFASVRTIAMPGFGVDQIWLSARHQAIPMKPDLLVVTLYPDDWERSFTAFRPTEGFVKPSFRLRNGELVERGPDDCPSAPARWLARRSRIFALLRRVEIRVARSFGAGPWFALNAAILDELRTDSERAGVPLLFVHIPYQTWRPFPALARYMERTGSEFIDLYDELGEEWSNSYFPRDGHLNTEGHRRLADLVAVRAASLLPARR